MSQSKLLLSGNAPVAFFAYKRPQHTLQSLESLSQNIGAEKSQLYIFCDGAKDEAAEPDVQAVRRVVRQKQWCGQVEIIERNQNWGLANSIISGVSELCRDYGKVIVVEDDLLLSPYFLKYMNSALQHYLEEPKVMHISGYMYDVKSYKFPETFFLRQIYCWGWATWDRAWQKFNPNGQFLLEAITKQNLQQLFSMNGSFNFYSMLEDYVAGKIDSWAIRWYASVFLSQGLSLVPHSSLTRNIGFDGTGTNCGKGSAIFDTTYLHQEINGFANHIALNIEAEQALRKHFNTLWASLETEAAPPSLMNKVKGKISWLKQYTKNRLLFR